MQRCRPILKLFDTLLQLLSPFYHGNHPNSTKISFFKSFKWDELTPLTLRLYEGEHPYKISSQSVQN
jgi:hypothetical protein